MDLNAELPAAKEGESENEKKKEEVGAIENGARQSSVPISGTKAAIGAARVRCY